MWKKRISLLLLMVLTLSLMTFVTGCGKTETAAPAPAPAAQPAPCPEVNELEIIKETAAGYFSLPVNLVDATKANEQLAAYNVIDIRSAEDYAKGHVPGAKNIPMAKMGEAVPTLPTDKPLLVYCYSGQTAGQTIAVLRMAGFEAFSLKGGFPSWTKVEPALPLEQ